MRCTSHSSPLPEQLQQLLQTIPYATIATVSSDGQPWNSPVVARFDDRLTMYWVSWKDNRHSQNIASEPRIFVVVYDSKMAEGQGVGLYLQMRAYALASPLAIKRARQIYDTSFFTHPFSHNQFRPPCPQRLYCAVPERIWYNTDGRHKGHFIDIRREVA
jgi:hypothetical protein